MRKRRKSKSKDAGRCLVRSGLDENSEIRVPRFRVPEADEHFLCIFYSMKRTVTRIAIRQGRGEIL